MSVGFDRIANVILIAVAVALGVAAIHREFATDSTAGAPNITPVQVRDWANHDAEVARAGVLSGGRGARIKIVEFADFECPFCRQFEPTLKAVRSRYGASVSRTFVYTPLYGHKFAAPAARVAECANAQGRFDEIAQALYAKQDSFGIRPWASYAIDAAVPDIKRFEACASATDSVPRVANGIALAQKLQFYSTPTIVVNGWKFIGGPPEAVLDRVIDDLLAGKRPRDAPAH